MVKIHAIAGNSPITFADTIIQQQNIEVAGHITASGNISNVSTTNVTASGDIEVGQYIKHKGDTNTHINFTDNQIRLNAGGINFLSLEDDGSAPYPATINNGGNRINFRVLDRNSALVLKTDSEAFNVGLYHAGNKKLETVVGGVDITGHVTASGNISASGTIFASRFESAGDSGETISSSQMNSNFQFLTKQFKTNEKVINYNESKYYISH